MTKEKKNRIITIISAIVSLVCLTITIFLAVNYFKLKIENDKLKENPTTKTQVVVTKSQDRWIQL